MNYNDYKLKKYKKKLDFYSKMIGGFVYSDDEKRNLVTKFQLYIANLRNKCVQITGDNGFDDATILKQDPAKKLSAKSPYYKLPDNPSDKLKKDAEISEYIELPDPNTINDTHVNNAIKDVNTLCELIYENFKNREIHKFNKIPDVPQSIFSMGINYEDFMDIDSKYNDFFRSEYIHSRFPPRLSSIYPTLRTLFASLILNNRGQSLLYIAGRFGSLEIFKFILKIPDIDVNMKNVDGSTTAIGISFEPNINHNDSMIRLDILRQYGADLSIRKGNETVEGNMYNKRFR